MKEARLKPPLVDTMNGRLAQNAVWTGLVDSGGLVNGPRYVSKSVSLTIINAVFSDINLSCPFSGCFFSVF